MTRKAIIIERTIKAINTLPEDKAREISDFADFIMKQYEEYLILEGLQKLMEEDQVFDFLNHEEELYTIQDLKETYNG